MSVQISGAVVREMRVARGWTQEHLAAAIKATPKTIQRVERSGICSLETRSALLAVFEIELKQLEGQERIQQAKNDGEDGLLFYQRVLSGRGLVEIFRDAFAYRLTHEDARNAEDSETIASTLQEIQDWSEIWDDIDAGGRVRATFELGERIKELETKGILVFGLRSRSKWTAPHLDASKAVTGSVANVHLAYADSERVVVLDAKADV